MRTGGLYRISAYPSGERLLCTAQVLRRGAEAIPLHKAVGVPSIVLRLSTAFSIDTLGCRRSVCKEFVHALQLCLYNSGLLCRIVVRMFCSTAFAYVL